MKKCLWLFLSLLGIGTIVFLPMITYAQTDPTSCAKKGFGDTECVNGIAVPGGDKPEETWGELINVIKTFINWVLGLLGLIALVLCIWAGFQMVTATGDTKKFDDGKAVMKHAAIGLVIIGLSWLIVSLVFWIINNVTKTWTPT